MATAASTEDVRPTNSPSSVDSTSTEPAYQTTEGDGTESGSPAQTSTQDSGDGHVDFMTDTKPDDMSKNQWKKMQRQRRKELMCNRWKQRMREKDREKKEKKRKLREQQKFEPPPAKKKKMSHKDASLVRVAIDLGFDDLMINKDIKKLVSQCLRCYSANRKAEKPLQLYITSFAGESKRELETSMKGYQNWDVHFKANSFIQEFDKESIVFLAAESENVLTELDPSKVYIIGGLVDHNHHKGYCYRMAVDHGLAHAQLPISDYVQLNSRKVLTINHVFEIIVAFVSTGNWEEAFYNVIPKRKVFTKKEDSELHEKEDTHTQPQAVDLHHEQADPSGVILDTRMHDSCT